MASIGFNPNLPVHAGCGGMAPATPRPNLPTPGTLIGSGFALPSSATPADGERFIASRMGGVIVGADGAPAGRVPEGSFLDRTSGKVYGPDGKEIQLPEGASVDFFDLPDVRQLIAGAAGSGAGAAGKSDVAGASGAGDDGAPAKTQVDGQWGPGGVTDLKGSGTDASAPTKTADKDGSKVAGASGSGVEQAAGCDHHGAPSGTKGGGGLGAATGQLTDALSQLQALGINAAPGSLAAYSPQVLGGGMSTAVAGASGLGSIPSLQLSLMELVRTLDLLARALQETSAIGGGTPAQKGSDSAVDGASGAPAKEEPSKVDGDASPTPTPKPVQTDTTEQSTPATEESSPSSTAGAAGAGTKAADDSSSSSDVDSTPSSPSAGSSET